MRWASSIARGTTQRRAERAAAGRGAAFTAWPAKEEAAIVQAMFVDGCAGGAAGLRMGEGLGCLEHWHCCSAAPSAAAPGPPAGSVAAMQTAQQMQRQTAQAVEAAGAKQNVRKRAGSRQQIAPLGQPQTAGQRQPAEDAAL